MSLVSLASLLVQETKSQIYARGIAVAKSLGLDTTSWVTGDPTRSYYHFLSEVLEIVEKNVAGFVASGFLDYATGDWLTLLAKQVFNVDRTEGTYASCTIELTNSGGGLYVIAAGDITVRSSANGKTYRNTTAGTLESGAGKKVSLTFVADESGSASTASISTITTMVTNLIGVTCSNTTAAIGVDQEKDDALRDRCRAKLGMLSPNGPRDAYNYVVRSSALTGVTDITRARTVGDSTTGNVTTYVAGSIGMVAAASVTAALDAVTKWAAPICITPTVSNVTEVTVNVTYQVWLYSSVGVTTTDIAIKIAADLQAMFSARPIGGDIISPASTGSLYHSLIESTIKASYPDHTFRVLVTAPAGDTALAISSVAKLGAITPTVTLEAAP